LCRSLGPVLQAQNATVRRSCARRPVPQVLRPSARIVLRRYSPRRCHKDNINVRRLGPRTSSNAEHNAIAPDPTPRRRHTSNRRQRMVNPTVDKRNAISFNCESRHQTSIDIDIDGRKGCRQPMASRSTRAVASQHGGAPAPSRGGLICLSVAGKRGPIPAAIKLSMQTSKSPRSNRSETDVDPLVRHIHLPTLRSDVKERQCPHPDPLSRSRVEQ
jgi:hypothetical protein